MADLIEKERAVRAFQGGVPLRLLRHACAWVAVIAAALLGYLAYAAAGMQAHAALDGHIAGLPVNSTVAIYRDARGIPHIRAATLHDAYFAEGFAQGSDRLFQMDLFRRYIYGELAEMLGPIQLPLDERMRALDVHDIVARQWQQLSAQDRDTLQAFADGVNAALHTQPLPVEFRLLLYRPAAWAPQDCLAVTLAISSSLGDEPENVVERDALWRSLTRAQYAAQLPLSDPRYDVSAAARLPAHVPPTNVAWAGSTHHVAIPAAGSNAWAAGAAHVDGKHALLANDPHLTLGIPGIWYAVEIRAPGLHVAGLTIPGIPGIVLGHNEHIAWGTTTAMATTLSVFREQHLDRRYFRREIFHVRFARDVTRSYYRASREFEIPGDTDGALLVRWSPYTSSRSAIGTVLELDRARSVPAALAVLSRYDGPPQNFVLAGDDGRVAYHLAGTIPDDPAWGRYVHRSADLKNTYPRIAFSALPGIAASHSAVVVSANNKMYGSRYRYRLSAMFAPPYRAYRIARLLHARSAYDAAYFARMQLDQTSPADAEFAHRLAAYARKRGDLLPPAAIAELASWDGSFAPASRAATLERSLRESAERAAISPYGVFSALRSTQPPEQLIDELRDPQLDTRRIERWSQAGAVSVLHPFGSIGFPFLNGPVFEGAGDVYTIRVQTPGLSQSFRAVWEPGEWDRGGLSLPTGESGEIGSPHYADLRRAWARGILQPLPFSDASVMRSAKDALLLEQ
jgi:penicillin amidase